MASRITLNFEELSQNWNVKERFLYTDIGNIREDDVVICQLTFDCLVDEFISEGIRGFIDDLPSWLKPIVKSFAEYYYRELD